MKHKRITKLLKKISVLNESIAEDDEFSVIERDHMVNYIKELYEEAKGAPLVEEVQDEAEIEEALEEEYELVEEVSIEEEEILEEIDEVEEPEAEAEAPASIDAKEAEVELIEEITEQIEATVTTSNPELEAIFEENSGDDLSDRLSTMPIKDLTKSMGINEKIFTVKELFGDDNAAFNNMMEALNGLSSFDEAKRILINSVAVKYDWAAEKKVKKAEHFVRLVRRRYM